MKGGGFGKDSNKIEIKIRIKIRQGDTSKSERLD